MKFRTLFTRHSVAIWIEKLFYTLLIAEMFVLATVVATTVLPIPFGYQSYAVMTGSMDPQIPIGSLAYIDTKASFEEIIEGDVIAYKINETSDNVCMHRVTGFDWEKEGLITKGDANEYTDLIPIESNSYKGKEVGCIPCLGFIVDQLANAKALVISIIVSTFCACITSAAFVSSKAEKENQKGLEWKTANC